MALSLPHTEQKPHFERIGFKVEGKRMYASYLAQDNTANIFLTPEEQVVFCNMNAPGIYPIPSKWGQNGATTFELNTTPKELVMEALISAYNQVLKPKK